MSQMQLYSYYRSSCAYRARLALRYKGLPYTYHAVHLVRDGGEQHKPAYAALNPQELVPTFIDGDFILTQSMAIMEYLEETYPQNPILPTDARQRAYVRQISLIQVADIHPLNNLKVLQHLSGELHVTQAQKTQWYHKWIVQGFDATEKLLARSPFFTGAFVCGDRPTMADMCLVPQVYNAIRYELSLDAYPLIRAIHDRCMEIDSFVAASPEYQPDAPEDARPAFLKGKNGS